MLGAVAQATHQVDLYSYVTCPTMRYHPAIVAQQAATVQTLSDGRFTLGLGSGENLNEHVVGKGWPTVERRQDMLREAIEIIRALFGGGLVNWRGEYFQVDSARLWEVPDVPVGIGVAMGGTKAVDKFATLAEHLIAVKPDGELVRDWHGARLHRCRARPDRWGCAGALPQGGRRAFACGVAQRSELIPGLDGAFMNRSLTIKTGQCHVHRYMRPLLDRIRNGEIDPTIIVSHHLRLDQAPRGYEIFKHKQDGCTKVILNP